MQNFVSQLLICVTLDYALGVAKVLNTKIADFDIQLLQHALTCFALLDDKILPTRTLNAGASIWQQWLENLIVRICCMRTPVLCKSVEKTLF